MLTTSWIVRGQNSVEIQLNRPPRGTILTRLLQTDPRASVKAVKHKVSYFDLNPGGTYPKLVWDRWVTKGNVGRIL